MVFVELLEIILILDKFATSCPSFGQKHGVFDSHDL